MSIVPDWSLVWGSGKGETHKTAGACQTMFIDVENPEASTPVTADSAKSGENVALEIQNGSLSSTGGRSE